MLSIKDQLETANFLQSAREQGKCQGWQCQGWPKTTGSDISPHPSTTEVSPCTVTHIQVYA